MQLVQLIPVVCAVAAISGCASRRVDVFEEGTAVLRVRSRRAGPDSAERAKAAVAEALDAQQFLEERVRSGFAASLGGALGVDPAAVLVGQNPIAFPLPMPAGFQVAVGYAFTEPRVGEEDGWLRVRCKLTVAMALLEVPEPEAGSYDGLAVWAAQGYVARSLQDAGFDLDEASQGKLLAPPFTPGSAD